MASEAQNFGPRVRQLPKVQKGLKTKGRPTYQQASQFTTLVNSKQGQSLPCRSCFLTFCKATRKGLRRPIPSIFRAVLRLGGLGAFPGVFFDVSQGRQKRPPEGRFNLDVGLFWAREASRPFRTSFSTFCKATRLVL